MGSPYVEFHAFNDSQHTGCGSGRHTKTFCGHETNGRNDPIKASLGIIIENNRIEAGEADIVI